MENEDNKFDSLDSNEPDDKLKKIKPSQEEPEDSVADSDMDIKNQKDRNSIQENDRHPTGDPESTAGWFSDDLSQIEHDQDLNKEDNRDSLDQSPEENHLGENVNEPAKVSESEDVAEDQDQTIAFSEDELDKTKVSKPTEEVSISNEKKNKEPIYLENQGLAQIEEEIEKTPPRPIKAYVPPSITKEVVPPPPGATQPILPNRTNVNDTQATRVSPVAYRSNQQSPPISQNQITQKTSVNQINKKNKPPKPPKSADSGGFRQAWGCFIRMILIGIFIIILGLIVVGSIGVYQYYNIAQSLPPVEELREKAAKFETTRILDRNGNVIYEILDPNAGRRTYVPLEKISPYLIAATLATEDKEYYNHPGFDPVAVARAFYQNLTAGDIVSGASTITQQLARMLLLDDTERYSRTYERKTREIVLAAEITRKYSKEEILEIFLNENNYGNHAYGVQAAAETYFNTKIGRAHV